ncbi:hypothetical protein LP416_27725 [Polaromonas sp. P2-4]|nr:hypothetical protein LP416_27725 [Polaromonas sp. P2-4]
MSAGVLAHYSPGQIAAIQRLYELVRRHNGTSGGNSAAKLLLGLYNGYRFPFDLTNLRSFDPGNFEAAMTVIRMDAVRCYCEVHVLLDAIYADGKSTGCEFETWAYNQRMKGRCSKDNLPDARRIR